MSTEYLHRSNLAWMNVRASKFLARSGQHSLSSQQHISLNTRTSSVAPTCSPIWTSHLCPVSRNKHWNQKRGHNQARHSHNRRRWTRNGPMGDALQTQVLRRMDVVCNHGSDALGDVPFSRRCPKRSVDYCTRSGTPSSNDIQKFPFCEAKERKSQMRPERRTLGIYYPTSPQRHAPVGRRMAIYF